MGRDELKPITANTTSTANKILLAAVQQRIYHYQMANRFLDTFPYFSPYFTAGSASAVFEGQLQAQVPSQPPAATSFTQHPTQQQQSNAFNYQNPYYNHFVNSNPLNR